MRSPHWTNERDAWTNGRGEASTRGRKTMPASVPRPIGTGTRERAFYDALCTAARSPTAGASARGGRSRRGKADRLRAPRALPAEGSLLDVGCGDGALLVELSRAGRSGFARGSRYRAGRGRDRARSCAGRSTCGRMTVSGCRGPTASFDVGVLSHVLEHVDEPVATLREVARVCRRVAVEVPLERNLAAARRSRRRGGADRPPAAHSRARHARGSSRGGTRVPRGGDRNPLRARRCGSSPPTPFAGRRRPEMALQRALHRCAPALAARLFTVHYLGVCEAASDVAGGHPARVARSDRRASRGRRRAGASMRGRGPASPRSSQRARRPCGRSR